jgi:aspartate/methionine/tyrosine aminotransferase
VSGWRLGWMIVPDELIDTINSLQQNMFINAPTISQTAALHCWDEESHDELQSHVTKYGVNLQYILHALHDTLLQQGCTMSPSDGGFYIYIDLGPNVALPLYDSVALCALLLDECHVAFTPGIDFENPATTMGYVRFRISYSQSTETIQMAMQRFVHIFWPTWVARVVTAKKEVQQQEPSPATITASITKGVGEEK